MRPIPGDGFSVGWRRQRAEWYDSGITLGVLIERLLSMEVTDGSVDGLIRPFRPDRF